MNDIIERAKELIYAKVGSICQYDDVIEELIKELEKKPAHYNSDELENIRRMAELGIKQARNEADNFYIDVFQHILDCYTRCLSNSSESTIILAKRIAAMKDDSMDSDENIERWANKLGSDISKGND